MERANTVRLSVKPRRDKVAAIATGDDETGGSTSPTVHARTSPASFPHGHTMRDSLSTRATARQPLETLGRLRNQTYLGTRASGAFADCGLTINFFPFEIYSSLAKNLP